MKLTEIKQGLWYATKFGVAECIGFGAVEKSEALFRLNGYPRTVRARDVYGEAKKPEGAP